MPGFTEQEIRRQLEMIEQLRLIVHKLEMLSQQLDRLTQLLMDRPIA